MIALLSNTILLSSCVALSFTKDISLLRYFFICAIIVAFIFNIIHFILMLLGSSHIDKALKNERMAVLLMREMTRQKVKPKKFETNEWYLEFSSKQVCIYVAAALCVFLQLDFYQFIISSIVFDVLSFILFFEQSKNILTIQERLSHKNL